MLDTLITGATVVDGTGTAAVTASIGIRDGRIVAIGSIDEPAEEVIDAHGLVACPGFIDPHTHYDAQLFWDPTASPSGEHGVTTVIGGNCSFGLAPIEPDHLDYVRGLLAKVEGMPIEALTSGADWKWREFGDYLDALDQRLAVNAGFLVGHSTLRRLELGDEANDRPSDEAELDRLRDRLATALQEGALGLLGGRLQLPQRRRRPAGAGPRGRCRRAPRPVRGGGPLPRHDARRHLHRGEQWLRCRRGRPRGLSLGGGRPAPELERPGGRRVRPRPHRGPDAPVPTRTRPGRTGRRRSRCR